MFGLTGHSFSRCLAQSTVFLTDKFNFYFEVFILLDKPDEVSSTYTDCNLFCKPQSFCNLLLIMTFPFIQQEMDSMLSEHVMALHAGKKRLAIKISTGLR